MKPLWSNDTLRKHRGMWERGDAVHNASMRDCDNERRYKFKPDHDYIAKATEEFLANGGRIKKIVVCCDDFN